MTVRHIISNHTSFHSGRVGDPDVLCRVADYSFLSQFKAAILLALVPLGISTSLGGYHATW